MRDTIILTFYFAANTNGFSKHIWCKDLKKCLIKVFDFVCMPLVHVGTGRLFTTFRLKLLKFRPELIEVVSKTETKINQPTKTLADIQSL